MRTTTTFVTLVGIASMAVALSACSSTAGTASSSAAAPVKGNADIWLDSQADVKGDCVLDAAAQQLVFSEELSCPGLNLANRYVAFQPQETTLDLTGANLTSSRVAFVGGLGDIKLHGATLKRMTLTSGDLGGVTLDLTGADLTDTNLKSLTGNVTTDDTTIFCRTKMPKTGKANDRDC